MRLFERLFSEKTSSNLVLYNLLTVLLCVLIFFFLAFFLTVIGTVISFIAIAILEKKGLSLEMAGMGLVMNVLLVVSLLDFIICIVLLFMNLKWKKSS
jgi:hypothetical protein